METLAARTGIAADTLFGRNNNNFYCWVSNSFFSVYVNSFSVSETMNSVVDLYHIVRASVLGRVNILLFILFFKSVINHIQSSPTVDPKSRVHSAIRTSEEIEESMRHHLIIPEIIDYAPKHMLWVIN